MAPSLSDPCGECGHPRSDHSAGWPYPGCVHRGCTTGGGCMAFVEPRPYSRGGLLPPSQPVYLHPGEVVYFPGGVVKRWTGEHWELLD